MTTETPPSPLPPEEPKAPTPEPDAEWKQKIMQEKKNWAEKAKALEAENNALKQEKLKEKEDYKAMFEIVDKKAKDLEAQINASKEKTTQSIKYSKIKQEFEKLGLKDTSTAEKLFKHANLDAVKYDEELNVVLGHEEEAKRIYEDFKPMFGATGAIKPSHAAPEGAPADVSIDAYNKLVLSPEWQKMSKTEKYAYTSKVYEKMGLTSRK